MFLSSKSRFKKRVTATFPVLFVALLLNTAIQAEIPYINWENHPVHAIDVSPDGSRMAITHTADNRVQLFYIGDGAPVRMGHVKVGVDPVAVRFRTDNELWVVNHISDSISLVDFSKKQVIDTIKTEDEPFDVVFANEKAFVSCSQVNQVMVFDLQNLSLPAQLLDLMAEEPRAMTVNQDGSKVYVASFESGNKTTILAGGIDESANVLTFPSNAVNDVNSPYEGVNPPANDGDEFVPQLNPELPPAPKVSLIVRQNSEGRWLDDNNQDWSAYISGDKANLSGRVQGWELLDHDITVIDTETLAVSYASGLMNIGMAIAYNQTKNQVTLIGTDASNEIRFEPNLTGKFLRVNLGLVNANDLGETQVADLNPHLDYLSSAVEKSVREESIGDPRGIVWNASGESGYVTGMGSNNVIVIDHKGNRINQVKVGEGPTGLVLDEANQRLYVWNHFAASLSVIETEHLTVIDELKMFNPLPEAIKSGRKFLYDTHATSGLGQIACASCHVDGRMDRLAWDLGDPSGEVKMFNQNCQVPPNGLGVVNCSDFHPMKGPMMTQTFQDIIGHEPLHWRGDRDGFEEFNGAFVSLNGADSQLSNEQMLQFKNMVSTITFPPNPFREIDNSLPEQIDLKNHYTSGRFSVAGRPLGMGNPQQGLELYNSGLMDGGFQCASCHTLPTGMSLNGPLLDGLIGLVFGGSEMPPGPMGENHLGIVSSDGSTQKSFKTPQLRNMYEKVGFETSRNQSLAGFGFLHDGAIDSIARFISTGVFKVESDQDVADLVALMMAFSGSELDTGEVPLSVPAPQSKDTHAGVGQQYTLTEATQVNSQIEKLVSVATSGKVDLMVQQGNHNNYLYQIDTMKFQSSEGGEVSLFDLMSSAGLENPLTFTLVAKGLGHRLAFDRDGDGVMDRIEMVNGSNPADTDSVGIKPFAGMWFNPERSGHGFDLQFADQQIFITWFTFNDDGSPTWYLASNEFSENWHATLNKISWNADTRMPSSQTVGSVTINFHNATKAVFSWDINGRAGSEEFQYLWFDAQPTLKQNTGAYYHSEDSGWGITLTTQGNTAVSVIYFFDNLGRPRWAIGSGNNDDGGLNMMVVNGFCPDCEYVEPVSAMIGSQTMSFQPGRRIDFNVNLFDEEKGIGWVIEEVALTPLSNEFIDPKLQ